MKLFTLTAALLFCGLFAAPQKAQAIGIGVGVGVGNGGVCVSVGPMLNQRFLAAGMAVVYEPYIYTRPVVNVTTGKVEMVRQVGYTRRQVWLYLDTWSNSYFYFDRYGNLLPYQPNRW